MNEIKIFERPEFGAVRVVENDGEPWFVASDVARALGYERPNDAVNTHCKKVNKFRYGDMPHGSQPYNIIPESDVYRLVMRSNLPDAERFQDWVVEEVLPSIRKTGSYSMAPKTYAEALRALAAEVEMREAVEQQKQLAERQRDEAIRTKAEIGNRREATAMATASAAVRQRDALADRMGEGRKWKTVKAIPWLLDVFAPSRGMYSQVGKKLSEMSQRMGYPVHEVEDSTYGAVKAYHIAVIASFHVAIRKDQAMLGRYRKA